MGEVRSMKDQIGDPPGSQGINRVRLRSVVEEGSHFRTPPRHKLPVVFGEESLQTRRIPHKTARKRSDGRIDEPFLFRPKICLPV